MEKKNISRIVIGVLILVCTVPVVILFGFWVSHMGDQVTNIADTVTGGVEPSVAPEYRDSYMEESSVGDTVDSSHVMKTGTIQVAVDDIDTTLESITSLREELDASLVMLQDSGKGKDRQVYISIKVVEDSFEDLFNNLKDLDGEFESSSISQNDVTETVVDLEARLKNYESTEEQFLEILDSATTVEDTLAVQKELNEVRYNIESIESELEYISNQTDYSYITLYISQSSAGASIEDEEWRPVGIFREALSALVDFGKFFVNGLIWVVVFIPVIALVMLPVYLVQRKKK